METGIHRLIPRGSDLLWFIELFHRTVEALRQDEELQKVFVQRVVPHTPGRKKETHDRQSYADVRANSFIELFLEAALNARFAPGFIKLWGEETGDQTKRGPFEHAPDGFYIIWDPIDGTNNILQGLPFATAFSLVWKHSGTITILASYVFDHLNQVECTATIDGSCLQQEVYTCYAMPPEVDGRPWFLNEGLTYGAMSAGASNKAKRARFIHSCLEKHMGSYKTIGCSAVVLSNIARGTGALLLVHGDPKIEDVVCLLLLIVRAGGAVSWNQDMPLIAAANQAIHDQAHKVIMDKIAAGARAGMPSLNFPRISQRLSFTL